jgi:hypothetical protein
MKYIAWAIADMAAPDAKRLWVQPLSARMPETSLKDIADAAKKGPRRAIIASVAPSSTAYCEMYGATLWMVRKKHRVARLSRTSSLYIASRLRIPSQILLPFELVLLIALLLRSPIDLAKKGKGNIIATCSNMRCQLKSYAPYFTTESLAPSGRGGGQSPSWKAGPLETSGFIGLDTFIQASSHGFTTLRTPFNRHITESLTFQGRDGVYRFYILYLQMKGGVLYSC